MPYLCDNITCSSHGSSIYLLSNKLRMILFYPFFCSIDILAFNVFTKKLLFVETFVEHMRPIIYLPILFKYCFHFAHLHHLERPRLGVAGRNFAIVFARTDEHAAFYTWLDIPIRPDQKIVVVPAAV